jgi:hypothetical protein
MTVTRYEFRFAVRLSPTARAAFPELSVGGTVTGLGDRLYGPVSGLAHMRALLDRFQTMGLTVVELRQLPD